MTTSLSPLDTLSEVIPSLLQHNPELKPVAQTRCRHVSMPQGHAICQEGSACSHLAILVRGSVRIYKLGENGREITLYRIGPGESCVLTASCILSEIPFPAFAMAETPVEALIVPAETVRNWLALSAPWRDYVFGLVATRLSSIIHVVEDVVFRKMDQRIADYLLQRTAQGNQPRLQLTHQEIASDLGTSREVVSRLLKEFEHQGLVQVARGALEIVDAQGLADRLCD